MTTHPPRLPLTVLAGFLGSGKTTILNRLLARADGLSVMVLVNDFGEIEIDAELIAARDGDLVTLANGCVCCSFGGDLFAAFNRVLDADPRPDHVVIEASGVAEPDRIADFARAEPDLRLDRIITLVDALNWSDQIGNDLIVPTLKNQVKAADLLVMTKLDLDGADEPGDLRPALSRLNPHAEILGPVPADALATLMLSGETLVPGGSLPPAIPSDRDHHAVFESWSYKSEVVPSRAELVHLLERGMPPGLLRLKGVACPPYGETGVIFHMAGRQHSVEEVNRDLLRDAGLRVVAIASRDTVDFTFLENRFAAMCGKGRIAAAEVE